MVMQDMGKYTKELCEVSNIIPNNLLKKRHLVSLLDQYQLKHI